MRGCISKQTSKPCNPIMQSKVFKAVIFWVRVFGIGGIGIGATLSFVAWSEIAGETRKDDITDSMVTLVVGVIVHVLGWLVITAKPGVLAQGAAPQKDRLGR